MNTTVTEPSIFSNDCLSYIYVAPLDTDTKNAIKEIQDTIAKKFGREYFWFPDFNTLHVTIAHIISPDSTYSQPPYEAYRAIADQADLSLKNAIQPYKSIKITFDTIQAFQSAIIVTGNDDGSMDSIRNSFVSNVLLPHETRRPPNIIHSTIARFLHPLDVQELQEFIKNELIINQKFLLQRIDLVSEKKIFLQDFTVIKSYDLA